MRTTLLSLLLLAGLGPAVAAPVAPSSPKPKTRTLDEVLKGKVALLDGGRVEITYDFSKKEQLEDWVEFTPFRVAGTLAATVEPDGLKLKGVGALHHRMVFDGDASLTFDLTLWSNRDLGAVVAEAGHSEQHTLFCLNDLYFQKFDGAKKPSHMICRFGVVDPSEPKGNVAFRYIARGTAPKIRKFQKITVFAEKKGKTHTFTIGDKTYTGRQVGRDFTELLIGIYVVKSTGVWGRIVVRGNPSPRWLEKEGVKLALKHAPSPGTGAGSGPSEADVAAGALILKYRAGRVAADRVVPLIGRLDLAEDLRRDAARALVESGDKTVVPRLVNVLYSEDELTRELGAQVLKGLTGKTFGYVPGAPEESRRKAIQRLIKYIQKKPKEFGRSK